MRSIDQVRHIRRNHIRPFRGKMWQDPDDGEYVDLNRMSPEERGAKEWVEVGVRDVARLIALAHAERVIDRIGRGLAGEELPEDLQDVDPDRRAAKIMNRLVRRFLS